jgi:acyl-CoA hydrolase
MSSGSANERHRCTTRGSPAVELMVAVRDRSTLRILASPQDTAWGGRAIAPGRILEWIDKAGYACAVGWAGSYCVTAYVGNVRFTRAVEPGQLIELNARIIHTGRTSMQILVTVSAADIKGGRYRPALDCILVFVAVDDQRRPREIPQWEPTTEHDRLLHDRAQERLCARRTIRDAMLAQSYSERGTTPRSKLRMLAAPGDANWGGNAHGGTVMRWINDAAYAVAASWSTTDAIAAYSGGIHFLRPIKIGHIVEVDARLIHTGCTTMHIATRVSSTPAENPAALTLTTVCMSIFIDPDSEGEPRAIEPITLLSDEDLNLDEHARELIAIRRQLQNIPA